MDEGKICVHCTRFIRRAREEQNGNSTGRNIRSDCRHVSTLYGMTLSQMSVE